MSTALSSVSSTALPDERVARGLRDVTDPPSSPFAAFGDDPPEATSLLGREKEVDEEVEEEVGSSVWGAGWGSEHTKQRSKEHRAQW